MIISPPFLPAAGLAAGDSNANPPKLDSMMDLVDTFELAHGIYPVAFDRRWHCGVHLMSSTQNEKVRAIADGEVVAYRVCQKAYDGGEGTPDSNAGFVLLKHTSETGEGRTITFYSLYMHLLDLNGYQSIGADGKLLPEFLRTCSPGGDLVPPPAQAGGDNRKVRRKDVLGWVGGCHGQRHLHFEIFMIKADYEAYFGATQLGRSTASMATSKDCWGHSYYVIPAGKTFLSLPPGVDSHNKLKGIAFDALQTGQTAEQLFVEMFFYRGNKYTNVWSVAGDGKRISLTPNPVKETDYEYSMYKRATALYSACASDGYELLRFGRILSEPVTLTNDLQVTWMRITFAAGQEGYIDVSDSTILKLSDADFFALAGWQKITEGNTPFSTDGLCDIEALKRILRNATDHQTPQDAALKQEYKKEDVLAQYVKTNGAVREQLRGFICEAPSEWDSTQNEKRYGKLLSEGEFYHGDPAGYAAFIKLLESFQFWDKTGIATDQKLWFVHPLAFIRHFRKCGWMSKQELSRIYPDHMYSKKETPNPSAKREQYRISINLVIRKHLISTPQRMTHFFGQGAVESFMLARMMEASTTHFKASLAEENDGYYNEKKDHYYDYLEGRLGNAELGDGMKFRGRGLKQLTGRENYAKYWVYRGWIKASTFDLHWWTDEHRRRPDISEPQLLSTVPFNCIDAGGWYWEAGAQPNGFRTLNSVASMASLSEVDVKKITFAINGGVNGLADRLRHTQRIGPILNDETN